jgi:hypothetical protein
MMARRHQAELRIAIASGIGLALVTACAALVQWWGT